METIFMIVFAAIAVIAVGGLNYYKRRADEAEEAFKDIAKKYRRLVNDPFGNKEDKSRIVDH